MVNVGEKPITERFAVAIATLTISRDLAKAIRANTLKKGDVFAVARIAGIQAAKRTDELIPLCHSLPLDHVDVQIELKGEENDYTQYIHITATATTHARTGVEMEALTAASIAALTVIDMGKSIDKEIEINHLGISEKRGGRSGHFIANRIPM